MFTLPNIFIQKFIFHHALRICRCKKENKRPRRFGRHILQRCFFLSKRAFTLVHRGSVTKTPTIIVILSPGRAINACWARVLAPCSFFFSLLFFSTPSRRPQLILLPRGIPEQQARPLFYLNSLPCSTRGSVDLLGLFGNIFTRDNSQVERNWISISLIKYFNQSSITDSDGIINRDWKRRILENL